jgi:hypothetical protein
MCHRAGLDAVAKRKKISNIHCNIVFEDLREIGSEGVD